MEEVLIGKQESNWEQWQEQSSGTENTEEKAAKMTEGRFGHELGQPKGWC